MAEAISGIVLSLGILMVLWLIIRFLRRWSAEGDIEAHMLKNDVRQADIVFRLRGHRMNKRTRKAAELWLAERVVRGYRDE